MQFNVDNILSDFPILSTKVQGKPLVYFDNAATTQKPLAVIASIDNYYKTYNSNVHRGVHTLSAMATKAYEDARITVQNFINAKNSKECIFVRGTTEAINLVANSFVLPKLKPGDSILISYLEHHSNIVPWQLICEKSGARLLVINLLENGELDLDDYALKLKENPKFVALSHASNALGTINPIKTMIQMAHQHGSKILIDGAQAIAHLPVDVQDLACDFYAFSGHKLYGPTGIGVLWGKEELLDEMSPYQGGGDMIRSVTFKKTEYAGLPYKFEAGTPNISGAIGLGEALNYLNNFDLSSVKVYEDKLLEYATQKLLEEGGYKIIGTAVSKVPVLSFVHDKIHPHDIGTILDSEGVAIRSGHHCAMPVMEFYKVPATARMSFAMYNTVAEIDACIEALKLAKRVFA